AGICVGGAAVVILCAVRLVRAGVWIDEKGLRLTGLFSATTVRWSQVTAIRTTQQPVRWLGLPRSVQGQAVLIELTEGGAPRVAFTDHGADFLGRPEAFVMAADAIESRAARYR
ncbi:PH domain-containing protein, partial [Streptomyces sp. MCAF7]